MADHPGRPPFAARDRRLGRVRGGATAIGIRLAVVEPRISAAVLFAGSFVPHTLFEEARQVTIPLQVLLQWDDEGMELWPSSLPPS
jgi:hypothetical protein